MEKFLYFENAATDSTCIPARHLVEMEMDLVEAILALRAWEQLVRQQLAEATGPGQLFSPLELPDEW